MPEASYRKIYTGHDLMVGVFLEDPVTGLPQGITDADHWQPGTDTPILSYCFFETAQITGTLQQTRRPATGDAYQRLVNQQYEYSMRVDHMQFARAEFDRVSLFNRTTRLRIYMRQNNIIHEDQRILIHATGSVFSITAPNDNGTSSGSGDFQAEEYATWHP